jgi:hypothetical protein
VFTTQTSAELTTKADYNGTRREPIGSDADDTPVPGEDGARQFRRTLKAGAQIHDRARCMPDRPGCRGIWRALTDKARCRRAAAILVRAIPSLIPKLMVRAAVNLDHDGSWTYPSPMSLIFATQLSAAATTVLAVFAFTTAILAYLAFRKQSREVRDQAQMLKVQSDQLKEQQKINELQAADLRASIKQRKLDADERRREQARVVSAWIGKTRDDPDRNGGMRQISLELINGSPEPIYGLVAGTVFIQGGTGPKSLEAWFEIKKNTEIQEHRQLSPPTVILSILPPGRWRTWVQDTGEVLGGGRRGAELAFTDRAGAHWVRRAKGDLEELASTPFDHLGNFGLYGPPYDFRVPEPAD